jgi:hypothetical protein
MKKLGFLFICLFVPIASQARVITVDDDGPADFNTIQAATNDSNDGGPEVVFTLNYAAESYAYSYADVAPYPGTDSRTDHDFSSNRKTESLVKAHAVYSPFPGWWAIWQDSNLDVSIEALCDVNEARLVSAFRGSGQWCEFSEFYSSGCIPGGGSANGYTSLTGTINCSGLQDYLQTWSALAVKLNAEATGSPASWWNNWTWWLKIWDKDPNSPLLSLSDTNRTGEVAFIAGQTLNFAFCHGAEEDSWPGNGLNSTLTIHFLVLPIADLDDDGSVNFVDCAILTNQWLQQPGFPSADIAPIGGDGIVNVTDLALFAEQWLERGVAHWCIDGGDSDSQ